MARPSATRTSTFVLPFLLLSACGGGGGDTNPPPPPIDENVPPTAFIAGPDKAAAFAGDSITLDASSASDTDGSIASVQWNQVSGPDVEIADPAAIVLQFAAPSVTEDTELVFELTVTDDDGATATQEIRLLIHAVISGNLSPSAMTAHDLVVRVGDEVRLDARGSTDADGSIATFAWTQIGGPAVLLTEAASSVAVFTAPATDAELLFRVITTDDDGATDSNIVRIRSLAANANKPPQAMIVTLKNPVPEGTGFTLDGGISSDPENAELDFNWTAPAGFTVKEGSADTSRLQLVSTPDVKADTSYMFMLVVSDGQFTASSATEVIVEAFNRPPAVSIETTPGSIVDGGVNEGSSTTLTVVATDPDKHAIESFTWKQLDGDEILDLTGVTGPALVFDAPDVTPEGDRYEFSVTVKDSEGAAASATIAFDVNFVNREPAAALTADVNEASEGTPVHLDATGSSDPDEQTLSFRWEQVENGMLPASIVDNGNGTADIVLPNIGPALDGAILRVRAIVDDQHGSDNSEAFAETDIVVRFLNQLPHADAGLDVTIPENADLGVQAFRLDARGSNDLDADIGHQVLTYTWEVPVESGLVLDDMNALMPRVVAVPNVSTARHIPVTLRVSDGLAGAVSSTTVVVEFVNGPPAMDSVDGPLSVVEGNGFTLTANGHDDDTGQIVRYVWTVPGGFEIEAGSQFSPTLTVTGTPDVPASNAQTGLGYTFSVVAVDDLEVASEPFEHAVNLTFLNTAPRITSVSGDSAVNEQTEGHVLRANGFDGDSQALDYTWIRSINDVSGISDAALGIELPFDGRDLTFNAPDVNTDKTVVFNVTADDGFGTSEPFEVSVTIDKDGGLPVIGSFTPANPVLAEGAGHAFTLTVIASDNLDAAEVLNYVWTPAANFTTQVDPEQPHVLIIQSTPGVGTDGEDFTFRVRVTDSDENSVESAVNVHVDFVNQQPDISAVNVPESAAEGSPVTMTVNASDDDQQALGYNWNQITAVDLGDFAVDGGGVATFTAPPVEPDDELVITFNVTVDDQSGAANATRTSDQHSVRITFVNQSPVVENITGVGSIEEGNGFSLTANGSDGDEGHTETLAYEWTVPAGFTFQAGSENARTLVVTGTPDVGQDDPGGITGIFSAVAIDTSGDVASNRSEARSHSVTATFVNQPPTIESITPEAHTVDEGDLEGITFVVAANDETAALTYAWQLPAEFQAPGMVSGSASDVLTINRTPNVTGDVTYLFGVEVDDGQGGVVVRNEIPFTVNRVNENPGNVQVAASPSATTVPEGSINLTLTASATDDATPADGLSYTWSGHEAFTASANENVLTITATPNVTTSTGYPITVLVDDGEFGEADATVTLMVTFVNQPPTVDISIPDELSDGEVNENSGTIMLTANGNDDDGREPTYVWRQTDASGVSLGFGEGVAGSELSFAIPTVTANTSFSVEVTATDADDLAVSVTDSIGFSVRDLGAQPSVSITPQISQVFSGSDINLSTVTADLATPVTYAWSQISGDVSLGIVNETLSGLSIIAPEVTATQGVPVTVQVEANDGATTASDQLTFTVFPRPDEMPREFSLLDLDAVPVGRTTGIGGLTFESNAITVQGLGGDETTSISINGGDGSYSTDGITFTTAPGTVTNGDTVVVRLVGPAGSPGTVSTTLDVGEFSETFSVTGVTADFVPESMPGGVRWSWRPMQGVDAFNVHYAADGGTGSASFLGEVEGEVNQFERMMWVWYEHWGTVSSSGTSLPNGQRYDLHAVDVTGTDRDILGSRQYLSQTDSSDAITYIKSDVPLTEGVFGSAIAVNNAGDIMVVGAPREGGNGGERWGQVVVYDRIGDNWQHAQTLSGFNNDDRFGAAIALSGDGNVLAIAAPTVGEVDAGEVYTYRRDDAGVFVADDFSLRPASTVTDAEQFGTALAMSNDGTILAIGVPFDQSGNPENADDETASEAGAVYIYRHDGTNWIADDYLKEAIPVAGNRFGTAVAVSDMGMNGYRLFASRTGGEGDSTVYVYDRPLAQGSTWAPSVTAPVSVSNSQAGYGSTLSATRTAFGGQRFVSGSIVHYLSGSWRAINVMSANPAPSGVPVFGAISPTGGYIAVGFNGATNPAGAGVYDNGNVPGGSTDSAGAVRVYTFVGTFGTEKFLKASNPDDGDDFGKCVVFDNRFTHAGQPHGSPSLYVCAPGEDSAGTGVHPVAPTDMREDNSMENAGAIYIY